MAELFYNNESDMLAALASNSTSNGDRLRWPADDPYYTKDEINSMLSGNRASYSEVTNVGSSLWTAPANISWVWITAIAGGGGGGSGGGEGNNPYTGGGGGAGGNSGQWVFKRAIKVEPNKTYTITVGAGGAGGINDTDGQGTPGNPGGDTSFSYAGANLLLLKGGFGGGAGFGGSKGGTHTTTIANTTTNKPDSGYVYNGTTKENVNESLPGGDGGKASGIGYVTIGTDEYGNSIYDYTHAVAGSPGRNTVNGIIITVGDEVLGSLGGAGGGAGGTTRGAGGGGGGGGVSPILILSSFWASPSSLVGAGQGGNGGVNSATTTPNTYPGGNCSPNCYGGGGAGGSGARSASGNNHGSNGGNGANGYLKIEW